jgi:hypothetical protein
MACSSSVSNSSALVPPASLVLSDYPLPDDGSVIVSSYVLRKYFGFYEVSRVRLSALRQYPTGSLLPVVAPSLRHIIEHFPFFSREQYATIARSHAIPVIPSDRKDHIRDLLRVHICNAECMCNLLIFQHLKTPRRGLLVRFFLSLFLNRIGRLMLFLIE